MAEHRSFVEVLYRYLDKIEVICIVGSAVSVLAFNAGMAAATQGIIIFLSILAAVFFLNAHKPPSQVQEGEKKNFVALLAGTVLPKVLWIGCSVGVIGLQFHLLQLEGSRQMLMIATASSAFGVALFIVISIISTKATETLTPVLYRAVPLMLITAYFLYVVSA